MILTIILNAPSPVIPAKAGIFFFKGSEGWVERQRKPSTCLPASEVMGFVFR
jgi:hypothetical protein